MGMANWSPLLYKDVVSHAADLLANAGYVVEEHEPPHVRLVLEHMINMIFSDFSEMKVHDG